MSLNFKQSNKWEKKYKKAVADAEKQQSRLQGSIDVLRGAIASLSVVGDGIHQRLDEKLNDLRRIIHKNQDDFKLQSCIEDIAATLRRVETANNSRDYEIQQGFENLIGALEDIRPSKTLHKQIKALRSSLQAEFSEQRIPVVLEEFTPLLRKSLAEIQSLIAEQGSAKAVPAASYLEVADTVVHAEVKKPGIFASIFAKRPKPVEQAVPAEKIELGEIEPATEKSPGFLARLFERSEKNAVPKSVTLSLVQLVNQLSLPKSLTIQAAQVYDDLRAGITLDQLSEVIEEVAALITAAADQDQQRFIGFLQTLDGRLAQVQQVISFVQTDNEDSHDNSTQLHLAMQQHVSGMRSSIEKADNLDSLQVALQDRLDSILTEVDEFRYKEDERMQGAVGKIKALEAELRATQNDAEILQADLTEHRESSFRDPLTKLPNRQAYDERIKDIFRRYRKQVSQVTIAVCDIDNFKMINDQYGHLAGDKVLGKFGEVFRTVLRSADFVARYGGEEFVILLEGTGKGDASRVMEKLRQAIEETPFHFSGEPVKITMSFGVAELMATDNPESYFQRADEAMYAAKKDGRNKVVTV